MRALALLIATAIAILSAAPLVAQDISLSTSNSAPLNSFVEVTWKGPDAEGDYIALGNADGTPIPYSSYAYTAKSGGTVKIRLPEKPGNYAIVYANKQKETLHFVPIVAEPVSATLAAPDRVPAASAFAVTWTGPDNEGDHVAIGNAAGKRIPYSSYAYTAQYPGELSLTAPEKPGEYTVVYVTGSTVVTFAPFTVTSLNATIAVPETVPAGAPFTAAWTGPDNEGDRLRVHTAEGERIPHASYAYTALNPGEVELVAPEEPGAYTIAYVTGDSVVTTVPVTVVDVTASLQAEDEVDAGIAFPVTWTGPGNRRDVIVMIGEDPDFPVARAYIANSDGDTVTLDAPGRPGTFELRYTTPGGRQLAARPIRVVAPPQKPGTLVVLPAQGATALSALEVVLDASGSMLQKQDGARRIDTAKATLSELVAETVPPGTPFALRVFGHKEADSCRTDLEVPFAPLDRNAVLGLIGSIQAMNLAKTPIARSLELVESDLSLANGERVVVLITDGEETCEGDPAAAISALRGKGTDIRVNIVGYAIEDAGLAETFARWADLGGGAYFSAGSRSQLADALTAATQPAFTVVAADGTVMARGLAGDDPIHLPAGNYEVRFGAGDAQTVIAAVVRSETETTVSP